ncbi:Disease resistance RPP13-like protein 4 [Triticum urartu]|uniref:Disease resistance RPP13-like protein 4 n=1 Tax=Triticum urartu TaxID=4572 RepID=M7ZQD7_TRIUA|nr:Disease resistance RPP13-like protein 4 [Triticum urartu]
MEMMEAPISASQGAMRSLPRKLESLLSGPKQGLRAEEKKKLRGLQADLQGLIDNYLFEPSEVESPASTANFWMKDVRDLSYDIDDFIYELTHVAVSGGSGARISAAQIQKLPGVKISRFPEKLKRRQWISDEISGFRTRVKEAIQRHKAYLGGCRWRPSSSVQHSAPSPCSQAAIRLVGMDSSINQLCGWLANDGQPEHKVASIVGTSGVGKTTLAREVYRKIGGQFECRAFVQTSRKQDMRMLLASILSQVRRHHLPDSFEVHKLLFDIKEHLHHKTYIIVIDNLWASSTWDIISHALPKGNCCSRILSTTEVDAIAQTCCADTSKYIFKKEPLSEDESRELFLGTVFGHEAGCPQVLKEVSNEIIKRSGGLPLAIIILASLLAGQPASSIEHWNYIKNSLSSDSSTNTSLEGIKQVLNLGYDNLPHGLKACMLYLCLYEEDRVIWKEDLVKQWIAEGFICAVEVAQSYFDELVSRGMIQPVDINCNDEIMSCRVHHMVLHFIRYKSTEENFSIALDHSQTTIRLADKVRRLALHFGNVQYATLPMTASMRLSQVRSLAFSGLLKCMPSFVEFRFIQVLILKLLPDPDNRSDNFTGSDDLSGNITEPDDLSCNLSEISELFRLRYFHLDACHMSVEHPTQMKQLKDLVAWEIDADVTAVPSDIVDVPGLFFLSIPSVAQLPADIGRMTSLRTLGVIDLSKNSTENIMCLGELINLQDLHLTCSTLQPDNLEKNLECLGLIVRKLSNLKCVTLVPAVSSHVKTQDDVGAPSMSISWDGFTTVSPSPALLQRLELSRHCFILSSLPEWTKDLTKLGILKMAVRKVSSEDVVILKGLPSLTALSLFVWTTPTRRIIFDNEGFLVLKYFKFVCLAPCLGFLDGAMPKVQNLKLGFNANRMERYSLVAAGFEHLVGLNKLSTKIGGAGTNECNRRSAELVFADAISKHPSTPIINIQWVDWNYCGNYDKYTEAPKEIWKQLGVQEKNLEGDANKLPYISWATRRVGAAGRDDATRGRVPSESLAAASCLMGAAGRHVEWALQVAMTRLEEEFHQLLISGTVSLTAEDLHAFLLPRLSLTVPTSNYTSSIDLDYTWTSDEGDESTGWGTLSSVSDGEISPYLMLPDTRSALKDFPDVMHNPLCLILPDTVSTLKDIADVMLSAGYAPELSLVYSEVRRNMLVECLDMLGVDKMSLEEVQRVEWSILADKMKKWTQALKVVIQGLLPEERRICNQIFAADAATEEECFTEAAKGCVLQLLRFGDAIAIGKRSSEMLFRILDMYEALAELLPELEALFSGEGKDFVKKEVERNLLRLGDAVLGTVAEFANAVQGESSRRRLPSGEIHPLTRYVMNYVQLLAGYSGWMNHLLDGRGTVLQKNADVTPPFANCVLILVTHLLDKIEDKSKLYDDEALRNIFLINNLWYIVQKVNDSELKTVLGDNWIHGRRGQIRACATGYLRSSWNRVLDGLRDDGLPHATGSSSALKDALKERFKNFNLTYRELYRTHTAWKVVDPHQREELQISISERVIPAYRSFVERYRVQLEGDRNFAKYVKYSPEDLENQISDFFEGKNKSNA